MRLREWWWDWNPKRLRRLLKQAKSATDANAYGWANTFDECVEWRKLVIMMNHFDTCTSARIECNRCADVRLAYNKALIQ